MLNFLRGDRKVRTVEESRSHVRIKVTYGATLFLFLGGALLIGYLLLDEVRIA